MHVQFSALHAHFVQFSKHTGHWQRGKNDYDASTVRAQGMREGNASYAGGHDGGGQTLRKGGLRGMPVAVRTGACGGLGAGGGGSA